MKTDQNDAINLSLKGFSDLENTWTTSTSPQIVPITMFQLPLLPCTARAENESRGSHNVAAVLATLMPNVNNAIH